METKFRRPKGRKAAISALNEAIEDLNSAKISNIPPAKAAFDSVTTLLTPIRDSMIKNLDYVELGLHCADVCRALDRGMEGKRLDELSQSACDVIHQLTLNVADIQGKLVKWGKRNVLVRYFHARKDSKTIATWRLGLGKIIQDFHKELLIKIDKTISADVLNHDTIVSDGHCNPSRSPEEKGNCRNHLSTQTGIPRESPPLPPRAFFGRDELIEEVADLAENLLPIALIGPGGIGKTSIALTVLHCDRVKQRFGDDRRLIRCDQLPASRAHFLHHLSNVIGAGVENPEDLTPLRSFLSSKEMLIVLDNAESILGRQGTAGQEIEAVVEELCRFDTICICITSQISAVPLGCICLDVPTLSTDAACDTFYRIYDSDNRSHLVNSILELLDFHPLSITLLASAARRNKWDADRLTREWEQLRTSVRRTKQVKGLTAAIELSLNSPSLQELGPDARALLNVVAFFPQGVNGDNLDWLFPAIPNRTELFDEFCAHSLTYRSGRFITMLGPLRDYFSPKDPQLSPLLCTTKDYYFTRMLTNAGPGDTQWMTSEDLNIEHLLDVFTTIDVDPDYVWDACAGFMEHLIRHNNRPTILQPKIEALPDDHLSKPECLFLLSRLFELVGNKVERKRLLAHTLKLEREQGDDYGVAQKLRYLADTNQDMGLYDEGIQQAREASEIYERHGNTVAQAGCLVGLAWLLHSNEQLDAAEEAASRAITLVPEEGNEFLAFQSHYILGKVYQSKEKMGTAIYHYETTLGIASASGRHDQLFAVHSSLVEVFACEHRFDDAKAHLKCAERYAVNSLDYLHHVAVLRAGIFCALHVVGGLTSGALCVDDILGPRGGPGDDMANDMLEFLRCAKQLGMERFARDWYDQYGVKEITDTLHAAGYYEQAAGDTGDTKDVKPCKTDVHLAGASDRTTASC